MAAHFANCERCGRLNLRGQSCACFEVPLRPCDCTGRGNVQRIGPNCRAAIHEAWSVAINMSRHL